MNMQQDPLPGRLPDFVVVGAPKAGTTSIHRYLGEHPEIGMSPDKGPRFFGDGEGTNFQKGLDWYRSLFQSDRPRCGEVSAVYSTYPTNLVASRMAQIIPQARLVYLVREPWARMISHHKMHVRNPLRETLSLADDLQANPKLRHASRCGLQVAFLQEFFPPEQILVLESTYLSDATPAAMREIFQFVGVSPDFTSPLFLQKINTSQQGELRAQRYAAAKFRRTQPGTMPQPELPPPTVAATPVGDSSTRVLIPANLIRELHDEYCREVDQLRLLTRQPFPSLEVPPLADLMANHT